MNQAVLANLPRSNRLYANTQDVSRKLSAEKWSSELVCNNFFERTYIFSKDGKDPKHGEYAGHKCLFCDSSKLIQADRNGYGNLLSHLAIHHGHEENDFARVIMAMRNGEGKQKSLDIFLETEGRDIKNVYRWLNLISMRDIPLCFAVDDLFLETSLLQRVQPRTLLKYINGVNLLVEKKLFTNVEYFGLVFDMWNNGAGTTCSTKFNCFLIP